MRDKSFIDTGPTPIDVTAKTVQGRFDQVSTYSKSPEISTDSPSEYAWGEARPCDAAAPNCGELPLADVHSNGLYGTVCPQDCLIAIGEVSLAEIPLSRARAAGLF
jgi:hypothetical protein